MQISYCPDWGRPIVSGTVALQAQASGLDSRLSPIPARTARHDQPGAAALEPEPRSLDGPNACPSRAPCPGSGGYQTWIQAQCHCGSDGLGGLGLRHVISTHHPRT